MSELYSTFIEVKQGNSVVMIFTEPKMFIHSDEECLFLQGNRGALGFVVRMLVIPYPVQASGEHRCTQNWFPCK